MDGLNLSCRVAFVSYSSVCSGGGNVVDLGEHNPSIRLLLRSARVRVFVVVAVAQSG